MEVNKIYEGDCLEVLKSFEDESIDCCITSPPYWALRDYGTEPLIRGGDPSCEHDFVSMGRNITHPSDTILGDRRLVDVEVEFVCSKCGAIKVSLGLESTPQLYVHHLCSIFNEIRRVLKSEGTCWVNIGDSYSQSGGSGSKEYSSRHVQFGKVVGEGSYVPPKNVKGLPPKCLCLIPDRFAIEMIDSGWILRNKIIWYKPSCMPSSATDRFTVDFEEIFFFVKQPKYFFNQRFETLQDISVIRAEYKKSNSKKTATGIYGGMDIESKRRHFDKELDPDYPGRNMRTTWKVPFEANHEDHYAAYPQKLISIPIEAGCPVGGVVLDPFFGSGTTGMVARKLNRNYIGIELNPKYVKIAERRIFNEIGLFL
jgi:site-specific DNA-methyltransferase (cytosine-N4-specific)